MSMIDRASRRSRPRRSCSGSAAARARRRGRSPGRTWPGMPRIRSVPSICSSSALRQPASDMKRLPLADAAVGQDGVDLGHRAGVAGAAGGRDLRRRARPGSGWPSTSTTGLLNAIWLELGLLLSPARLPGGGGIRSATRASSDGRQADVEVGAQRLGDLLAEEGPERLAGDPPHHLADQVALGDRVVAAAPCPAPSSGAWAASSDGDLLPVVEVLRGDRLRPAGQAGRVAHQVADLDVLPCRWRRTPASTGPPARRSRARRGRPAAGRRGRSSSWWSSRR